MHYPLNEGRERRHPWIPDLSQILFWTIFFSAASGFFISYDTMWHVKIGEWIWRHRAVPFVEPGYSIGAPSIAWNDHEWLAQLVMYGLWRAGGFLGLRFVMSSIPALIFTSVYVLLRRQGVSPFLGALLCLLTSAAAVNHWLARPHVWAYLCLVVSVYFWTELKKGKKRTWILLPLTQLIWVNLHQSFLLQFGFAFAFLFSALTEPSREGANKMKLAGSVFGMIVILAAMTRINPYGWDALQSPVGVWKIRKYIDEWQPLDWTFRVFWYFLAYAVILVAALIHNRSRVRQDELIVFTGTVLLTAVAVRHVPVFVLSTLGSFVRHTPPLYAAVSDRCGALRQGSLAFGVVDWMRRRNQNMHERETEWSGHRLTLCIWITIVALSVLSFHKVLPFSIWDGVKTRYFPVEAVDFLQKEGVSGNILTEYAWGGYVMLRLGDKSAVFIDGRTDMYGPDRMEQYGRMRRGAADWKRLVDTWGIDIILGQNDWPLWSKLAGDRDWQPVLQNAKESVFVRKRKYAHLVSTYANYTRESQ